MNAGGSPKYSVASSNDSASYHQQGSRHSLPFTTPTKSQKAKNSDRLAELMAAMYPGVKIGHKYCVQRPMLVPKRMGWLWNTEDTATGVPFPRGWRPGAIALGVKKRFTRPRSITEPLSTPVGSKGKKMKRKIKTTSSTIIRSRTASLESYIEKKQPPTLCIKKEAGMYSVTMQPIKDLSAKYNEEHTEIDEQPLQFKIAGSSSSSHSSRSKTLKSSSSGLKIEYVCAGTMRKPVVKPEIVEMGVQYEEADLKDTDSKGSKKTSSKGSKKGASEKSKKKGKKGK